jgi:HAD superfamily hydrolase (TIGR01490 family)
MPVATYSTTSIAFFDLDGTVTSKDTLPALLKFIKGKIRYYAGLIILSPVLTLYVLGFISNHRAKEILLSHFLKGMDLDKFNFLCRKFVETKLPFLLRKEALHEIRRHIKNNTQVVIVSASPENWVLPWCNRYNIACIATKLEVVNNRLTGKIEGKNCHGTEKARNILKAYNLSHYSKIYAYGNSRGDLPMLSLATDSYYKPFIEKVY